MIRFVHFASGFFLPIPDPGVKKGTGSRIRNTGWAALSLGKNVDTAALFRRTPANPRGEAGGVSLLRDAVQPPVRPQETCQNSPVNHLLYVSFRLSPASPPPPLIVLLLVFTSLKGRII